MLTKEEYKIQFNEHLKLQQENCYQWQNEEIDLCDFGDCVLIRDDLYEWYCVYRLIVSICF